MVGIMVIVPIAKNFLYIVYIRFILLQVFFVLFWYKFSQRAIFWAHLDKFWHAISVIIIEPVGFDPFLSIDELIICHLLQQYIDVISHTD